MKKIFLLSTALIFSLYGCQDVNDDFDFLNEQKNDPKSYELTLSESNISAIVSATRNTDDKAYGEALQKDKMFSDNAPASILIPYLLPTLYYTTDIGSTVKATYQFLTQRDEVLSGLTTSSSNPAYTLSDADYKAVWGDPYATALTPSKSPATELPKILATNFTEASDGSYKIVQYFYSKEEPIVTAETNLYVQEFDNIGLVNNSDIAINGWLNTDLEGTRSWQTKVSSGNTYAQATSYNSKTVNDTWLITQAIKLEGVTKPYITFDVNVGNYNATCLSILVSTDFDGNQANIKSANWIDITSDFTIPTAPTSGYGTFASAGKSNLNAYIGKNVYIAFRYKGDDSSTTKATTTYQVDNVKVADAQQGREVETKELAFAAYQKVNGTWRATGSEIAVLQPEDYRAATKTNNYITRDEANKLLSPALLNSQPKVAGLQKVAVYRTSGNNFYADRLTYNQGEWTINSLVETRTDQFVLGTSGWTFDPTVTHTMAKEDFQLVVDYVKNNQAITTPKLVNTQGDSEYYYGFNTYRVNVTFRASDRSNDPSYPADGTDEVKLAFCKERTLEGLEVFLGNKYPDAQPQVDGIDQFAKIKLVIYYGPAASNIETFVYEFQCTGNKQWKFIKRTSELNGTVEMAE